jgi:hypothetical protein
VGLSREQVRGLIKHWSETRQHKMVARLRFEEYPGEDVLRSIRKKWLYEILPNASVIQVSIKGGWPASNQYQNDPVDIHLPKAESPVQLQMF